MVRTSILVPFALAALAALAACGSRTDMPVGDIPSPPSADGGTASEPRCGDGVVFAATELCDDGNVQDGDGCTRFCGPETCGDGVVQGSEVCDDGNLDPSDRCLPSCLPPFCGDGIVSANEECDEGADNRDQPAFLLSQPNEAETAVTPVVTAQDAVAYYAFSSASGHTGLERAEESRACLHASSASGALSLIISHGIDDNASRNQPDGRVEMDILGVPTGAFVALSDDPASEFLAAAAGSVRGRWSFSRNTDGGIVSRLPFPGSWTITIDARFLQGIGSWSFVDGNLARRGLSMVKRATLRAFDRPSECRRTCRRPRCGDGILDGGEVCDGTRPCAPSCKSFE